jgi:hypothetical protein
MKPRILLAFLGVLAVGYIGFCVGVKITDNRFKSSMVKASESLGYDVTEEEMVRLTVQMTHLVNDLDVQGLLNEQDTKEAALMMMVYRLLKEEKIEDALELSESIMKGYLLREDDDTNQKLHQKIRLLLDPQPTEGSDQGGVINSESLRSST